MRYLCLIYGDERADAARPQAERDACVAEHRAFRDNLAASGRLVAADPLERVRSAVTVRRRSGKLFVTDGPFAETKEQLGGFYLIDVRDLNDALRVASRIPSATRGTIEVRPVAHARGATDRAPRDVKGMRHLCLVCFEEAQLDALSETERDALDADSAACCAALVESGRLCVAHALAPAHSATLVRVRRGKLSLADGPYADTTEQIGGFALIAATDLDDAIKVAARMPVARFGSVEVRAVHPLRKG